MHVVNQFSTFHFSFHLPSPTSISNALIQYVAYFAAQNSSKSCSLYYIIKHLSFQRLLRASSRHRITNTAPSTEYRSDTLYSSRSGDSRNSRSSGHLENGRERRLTSMSSSGSGHPWSSRSWSRENSIPADGTE